jgi:hypothetical protein
MNPQLVDALDADRPAQAINRQPPHKITCCFRFAIEEQVVAVIKEHEIEQALALGRKERRPHGKCACNVACDERLEEAANVFAREADYGSIGEGGASHAP